MSKQVKPHSDETGKAGEDAGSAGDKGRGYPGTGPGKIGLVSDNAPGLVSPSGVNQRDRGAVDDAPMAGDTLNFDDGDITHPRGKTGARGGTWQARGADSGNLGKPAEVLSDRNGPSDPDSQTGR